MRKVLQGLVTKVDRCCGCFETHGREQGVAAALHVLRQAEGVPFVLAIQCEADARGALCEVEQAADDVPLQGIHQQLGLADIPKSCQPQEEQLCANLSAQ